MGTLATGAGKDRDGLGFIQDLSGSAQLIVSRAHDR